MYSVLAFLLAFTIVGILIGIALDITQPTWETKLSDTGDCYNFYYGNPAGITAIENCKE